MPYPTKIEAGKLRHRIELAALSGAQDSFGGIPSDQGTVYATVWASIEAVSGREQYAGQQLTSEVSHRIVIRWRPQQDVKASHLVWFGGRQFSIVAVMNPDERHVMLVLLCLERSDSARQLGGGAS